MPDIKTVNSGRAVISFADMFDGAVQYYTPKEFHMHLKNIIRLLNEFENYNVCLIQEKEAAGQIIYVKEEVGIIAGNTRQTSVVYAINEPSMTAAFWDYLVAILNRSSRYQFQKANVIEKLESIAKNLQF